MFKTKNYWGMSAFTFSSKRCVLNLKSRFGSIGSPHLFSEMAPADSIAALVGQWKSNDKLVKQAATGVMAVVGKRNELSRKEVCANHEILIPVVEHLGVPTFIYTTPFLFLIPGKETWEATQK